MNKCGKVNPGIPSMRCDNTEGNHRLCTGFNRQQRNHVEWVNPDYVVAKTVTREGTRILFRDIAAVVEPARRVEGAAAGLEGSQRAAKAWTQEHKDRVLAAIRAVALERDEFTTDEVWEKLDGSVPVTKGMTAMLRRADVMGILMSTGKTQISQRGGQHDHGQRLTIWCSLIRKTV